MNLYSFLSFPYLLFSLRFLWFRLIFSFPLISSLCPLCLCGSV